MKIKKIIIFGLILVALSASIYVVRAASRGFTGFSWIGNNLQGGLEQGDPIIGMISLKGTNHEVMIEGSSDQSRLVGSAWLGIGSTNDKFNDFTNQNDYPYWLDSF